MSECLDSSEILYSVIIPAYNEEDYLPDTLDSVKGAMSKIIDRGELIVVNNNSTDETPRIAEKAGAKVVFEPINQISRARNAGGNSAIGKYLVFVDADTLVSPELLRRTLDNLKSGKYCGGGSTIDMDIPLGWFSKRFMRFWNWLSCKRQLAAGSYVWCLKEGFDAINGFSENVYASEEIWFSRALRKWGKAQRLQFKVIKGLSVLTSGRKLEWIHPALLFLNMFLVVFIPFGFMSRRLCFMWYYRPKQAGK